MVSTDRIQSGVEGVTLLKKLNLWILPIKRPKPQVNALGTLSRTSFYWAIVFVILLCSYVFGFLVV